MARYLLFQLYAPLAAWGDVAVGESRPSATRPGRSALIGLLGAALGIRRDDEAGQDGLAKGYRFAVRELAQGSLLRDYHTAQVPSRAALKKAPAYTRRDELAVEVNTILSARDYRCDGYWQVAVEATGDSPPHDLEQLAEALGRPRFNLYLGRKACPPALPLQPQIVEADSLQAAFAQGDFTGPEGFVAELGLIAKGHGLEQEGGSLYWEAGMEAGISARQTYTRRDHPRTRFRWQFDERQEHHGTLSTEE
ncbi:type I-E CRISPR-associated protein Cas5/CasD [Magnetovirga frankeli]|uniref:type I-E CRISPR-associated protein Cas5/CasD n=1 Tax=Magnetovirga frankeli TaxID=947516 RepID=UPI0012930AB1|nr:type I-E CRISPR-associated protein Cas5/CasD [gamma proteobacterium SS-5]